MAKKVIKNNVAQVLLESVDTLTMNAILGITPELYKNRKASDHWYSRMFGEIDSSKDLTLGQKDLAMEKLANLYRHMA